jgi:DNA-binding beta-propeller fold protein YncE
LVSVRPPSAPVLLASGILAACGAGRPSSHSSSRGAGRSLPAAEPAVSPVPRAHIAGREVRVGNVPEGVAVDPARGVVAVATRRPGEIVLLSAHAGRVLGRIRFPGEARHLAFAAQGGALLIPSEPLDRLFVLRLSSRRLDSIRVGRHPHAAVSAAGRIFVGDELGRSISVIAGGRVVGRVGGFRQPGGLAAAGDEVAVVDVRANRLTLLDARSLRRVGTVNAGRGPTHAVTGRGGLVYVVDTRGDAIDTFATAPRLRALPAIRLPGAPYGIAIDPVRARLWVTLTATEQLAEIDLAGRRPRLHKLYATGRQPNTLAVNPLTGTVYVADAADDALQIIQP